MKSTWGTPLVLYHRKASAFRCMDVKQFSFVSKKFFFFYSCVALGTRHTPKTLFFFLHRKQTIQRIVQKREHPFSVCAASSGNSNEMDALRWISSTRVEYIPNAISCCVDYEGMAAWHMGLWTICEHSIRFDSIYFLFYCFWILLLLYPIRTYRKRIIIIINAHTTNYWLDVWPRRRFYCPCLISPTHIAAQYTNRMDEKKKQAENEMRPKSAIRERIKYFNPKHGTLENEPNKL